MKIAKRVLVGILAFAMLFSCLLVTSSATDGIDDTGSGSTVTIPDYADVLKYYDPLYSLIYDHEDFEDGAYEQPIYVLDAAKDYTKAEVLVKDDNSYLSILLGHILNPDARTNAAYRVDFDGELLDKVVIKASISAAHNESKGLYCPSCSFTTTDLSRSLCPSCSKDLVLKESKAPSIGVYITETDGLGTALVKFNFSTGTIAYYNGSDYVYVDGMTATEGAWYDVSIVCENAGYKLSVKNGDNVFEADSLVSSAYKFKAVNIGCGFADDNRDAIVMIDDVYVQAGIDDRNIGVDILSVTKSGLALLRDMLVSDLYDKETKLGVVEVFDTLTGKYGTLLVLDDESNVIISEIKSAMLTFFGDDLKVATDAINVAGTYSARLQHVEDNKYSADRVRALLLEVSTADYADVLLAYDAEVSDLDALKLSSEEFIAYIQDKIANESYVFSSTDYNVLKALVDETESIFLVDGETTYDPTYLPIAESLASYNAASNRYYSDLAKSKTFCENVAKAVPANDPLNTLTPEQFVEALAAYEIAAEIGFNNSTYPGMTEALVTFAGLSGLSEISIVAERFMDNVETADAAIYLFMKEEWLDKAEADLDANDLYPGVAQAKAKYNELRSWIENKKVSASEYIAAVNAIAGKSGQELVDAIAAATELKAEGDVQGYDGVLEANIALDNYKSVMELEASYATKFITLVNNIDDAKTLKERFDAINLATEAQGFANDTLAGVSDAKQKLVIATSLYDSQISESNDTFEGVANYAADLSGSATSLSDIIRYVIAAIKALFL
ncbi:MAG: hypothetical protein IKC87_01580 [Clostridia bacterium]|nr:hypothetical protein [Clostridia bacterium]